METSSTVVHSTQNAHTPSQLTKTMQEDSNKYGFDEEFMNKVMQQQEAIRESSVINMFDMNGVQSIASDMGSSELVTFIEEANADEYIEMAQEARDKFGL